MLDVDATGDIAGPLLISGIVSIPFQFQNGRAHGSIEIRNPKLWTPESPNLYDVVLNAGEDHVKTYFGMRTVSRGKCGDLPHESIFLNGQPVYWRGALDQSFNPRGIYTAPSDEFLKHDMELASPQHEPPLDRVPRARSLPPRPWGCPLLQHDVLGRREEDSRDRVSVRPPRLQLHGCERLALVVRQGAMAEDAHDDDDRR